MQRLVYANVHKILKSFFKERINDVAITELLFEPFIYETDMLNKQGEPFAWEKDMISKVVNRKANLPLKIRKVASDDRVVNSSSKYYNENIISKLNDGIEEIVISELSTLINNDIHVPPDTKKRLLRNAQVISLSSFLADIMLYVAKIDNKRETRKKHEEVYTRKPLPAVIIPNDIQDEEIPYVFEMLKAYSDDAKRDINRENIDKSPYYANYKRNRESFFSAESLEHQVRDCYIDEEPNPFNVAKQETYDGIIDTWDNDYPNGYNRLLAVLQQATLLGLDSCILARDTVWLTNSVKKGLCHMLVNDGKIKGWIK